VVGLRTSLVGPFRFTSGRRIDRGAIPSQATSAGPIVVWSGQSARNRTRKRDRWGQENRHTRTAAEWLTVPAPALRIVSDELWDAARERLESTRQVYLRSTNGQLWGRPLHGRESKYLLTGFAVCGQCGGTLTVRTRNKGRRIAIFYVCSAYHHRGRAVCTNNLEGRLPDADEAILSKLETQLLAEDVIAEGMRRAIERSRQGSPDADARRERTREALTRIETELERLTAAVLAGGEAATLVQAMRERERQRSALQRELNALERPRTPLPDVGQLQATLRARLGEWRPLLRAHVPQSRQMIRKLVRGRIVFTPNADTRGYRYAIPGSLARVFNGLANPQEVVDAGGIEPPTS
jgi:site-specific DNA recombinase